MSPKSFKILAVIAAIGIAIGICIGVGDKMSRHEHDDEMGQKLFADLPANAIRTLTVTSAAGEMIDLAVIDEEWVVVSHHKYPADFSRIRETIIMLIKLKSVYAVDAAAGDLARLELQSPTQESAKGAGIRVLLKSEDGSEIAELIIGKERAKQAEATPGMGRGQTGRYVRTPKNGMVALVSETFRNLVGGTSADWIDSNTFVKVDKIMTATAVKGGEELWRLVRDTDDEDLALTQPLADDEEMVNTKVETVGRVLSYPSFNGILAPDTPEDTLGFKDGRRFIVETFDGFTYAFDLGTKQESGDYPARISVTYIPATPEPPPEDITPEKTAEREAEFKEKLEAADKRFGREKKRYTGWTYLMSSWTVEDMILNRDDLVKKKKTDAEKEDEATIQEIPQPPPGIPSFPPPQ